MESCLLWSSVRGRKVRLDFWFGKVRSSLIRFGKV